MDYAKMMYATEVRKLAGVLYGAAFEENRRADQSVTNHDHWRAMHPVMSFVPAALAQLREIETQINDPD